MKTKKDILEWWESRENIAAIGIDYIDDLTDFYSRIEIPFCEKPVGHSYENMIKVTMLPPRCKHQISILFINREALQIKGY
jgi:hypothetical protein